METGKAISIIGLSTSLNYVISDSSEEKFFATAAAPLYATVGAAVGGVLGRDWRKWAAYGAAGSTVLVLGSKLFRRYKYAQATK